MEIFTKPESMMFMLIIRNSILPSIRYLRRITNFHAFVIRMAKGPGYDGVARVKMRKWINWPFHACSDRVMRKKVEWHLDSLALVYMR